jgi:hypothetical protein
MEFTAYSGRIVPGQDNTQKHFGESFEGPCSLFERVMIWHVSGPQKVDIVITFKT